MTCLPGSTRILRRCLSTREPTRKPSPDGTGQGPLHLYEPARLVTEHGARTPHDGCAWPRRPTVSGLPPRPSTERTLPAHRRAARRRADHPTRERALEVTPDRPPHPLLATAATAVSRRRRRDVSARTRRPARRWASTRRRELSTVGTVWPWRDETPPPPEHRPSRAGGCGGCLHARLLVWAQDSTSRLAWRC